MTAKEARKIILSDFQLGTVNTAEAMVAAVNALEKQIPKGISRDNQKRPCCPSCSCFLFAIMYDNFCHNCGQALDWHEETPEFLLKELRIKEKNDG